MTEMHNIPPGIDLDLQVSSKRCVLEESELPLADMGKNTKMLWAICSVRNVTNHVASLQSQARFHLVTAPSNVFSVDKMS